MRITPTDIRTMSDPKYGQCIHFINIHYLTEFGH
nr:MAG TPA: hypothetical protein [Caudoviricetes sp.]